MLRVNESVRLQQSWPAIVGLALALLSALAIATLPTPLNLVVVPGIVAALALLLVLGLAPILLVASVPIQDAGAVALGGAATITATQLLVAATVGISVVHMLVRPERLRWSPILIPYGAYLLMLALSLNAAQDLGAGVAEIYRWIVPLATLIILMYALRSRASILILASLVGLGAAAQALLGGVQAILGLGPESFAITSSFSRAYGTFGRPNTFGAFLELAALFLIPLAIWAAHDTWARVRHYLSIRHTGMPVSGPARRRAFVSSVVALWLLACAGLGLLGILLSFSRGAWLGTAAGILAIMLVLSRWTRTIAVTGLILTILVVAAGGVHYAPKPVRERFEQLSGQLRPFDAREVMVTDENFAAVERMAHWQTGLAMLQAHPVTGVGAGNYNIRFTEFAIHPGFMRSQGHAHNYYIHTAAETGIFGLVAYLTLLGVALTRALQTARRAPSHFGRALGLAAVGVTVALMVHNVFENLHVLNLGILLATAWALAEIGRSSRWRDLTHTPEKRVGRLSDVR